MTYMWVQTSIETPTRIERAVCPLVCIGRANRVLAPAFHTNPGSSGQNRPSHKKMLSRAATVVRNDTNTLGRKGKSHAFLNTYRNRACSGDRLGSVKTEVATYESR